MEKGEHIDLDSGVTIERSEEGDEYTVSAAGPGGRTNRVTLTEDDVRTFVAEADVL